MFIKAQRCRICGNTNLQPIISLGQQTLTGVFPRHPSQKLTVGPLDLVRCAVDDPAKHCGLVQLAHSYEPGEIYGDDYGYRSGLNRSMVEHLKNKVAGLLKIVPLESNDMVVDIGSNDGTTLSFYPDKGATLVGVDPSAKKFAKYYKPRIHRIAELFSAAALRDRFPGRHAKIVTSIAMFYDLEAPEEFIRQVASILAEDGIWHLEQSYLPLMLRTNAYDTICHEHIEYYALRQIKMMMERCGLQLIGISLNNVNGGSFALTVGKADSRHVANQQAIDELLQLEEQLGLTTSRPFEQFKQNVFRHREELMALLGELKSQGKRVLGYGASTKGNVILQFCGLTSADLPAIAEVNEDKFGAFTPGTLIPVISETEAHAMRPDYFLIMPWHFRQNLLEREREFLRRGGKVIFPLPRIEIVGA